MVWPDDSKPGLSLDLRRIPVPCQKNIDHPQNGPPRKLDPTADTPVEPKHGFTKH